MQPLLKMCTSRALRLLAVVCIAATAVGPAVAQTEFPRQPLKLVVPYPTGAGVDILARQLAEPLGQRLGQAVVVDNRGGANGIIGMEYVAKAPADGHTLILALDAQFSINPNLYKSLPYDAVKNFAPVTLMGSVPYVLFTNPKSGIKTVADLVGMAKKQGMKLNYSSSGIGSGGHMAAAMLESMAGINMIHIPNKIVAASLRDVAENDCQIVFNTYAAARPLVESGKLIPIAVSTAKRMSLLPNVPTVGETIVGYETGALYGLMTVAGTPGPTVDRLHAEVDHVMKTPDFRQKMITAGVEPIGKGPDGFAAEIRRELAKWKGIIAERGITAN